MSFVTVPFTTGSGGSLVSPTITGTDNGAETLQNKTIDASANTIKNSSNTAGHYLRNNGTQYVDNTIQGADMPAANLASGANGGFPCTPLARSPMYRRHLEPRSAVRSIQRQPWITTPAQTCNV